MNRALSPALIAGGILLVTFGVGAMDSFGSDVSRFFTGAPTDRAVWMLAGGVALLVVGLLAAFRRGNS